MALFYHGKKLTDLSHQNQMIGTLEHGGHTIYEHKISAGTVLWKEGNGKAFISSAEHTEETNATTYAYVKLDSNLVLTKPISKLKNGLTINVNGAVHSSLNAYTNDLDVPDGTKKSVNFSKTDLQSGKWLAYQDTQDYVGNIGSVKIRALDDKTIQFESINGAFQTTLQSDAVSALGTNFWLIISSVTAY